MKSNEEMEFELTYLVSALPDGLKDAGSTDMVDVYFPEDLTVHPRLRLRQQGGKRTLTKKQPLDDSDASAHLETTIQLDQAEFEALRKASNRIVEKKRYKIKIGGRNAEVDLFQGDLKGLVLIDFEFPNRPEMDAFEAPAICLADVTQENFIAGGLLSGRSYADIETDLERFNYEKIAY